MAGIEALGWGDYFARQLAANDDEAAWFPARVTGEERGFYRVQLDLERWFLAEVSGKLRHDANRRRDFAAVGDWVLCAGRPEGEGSRLTIHRVLDRRTLLSRKNAGAADRKGEREQLLAANVDTAFVMTSLNGDLNLRRLERYLTLIYDGGAEPVVLLTKSDLISAEAAARALETARAGVPERVGVHAISARTGAGLEALAGYLSAGRTVVLLGSSGTGKSTLANRLLGREAQKTREIREDDDRGRHTTTSRSLLPLESGAMLIDTPGMREIQMLSQEEGLAELYPDVAELILRCKFTDCAHESEPGCAVRAALEGGSLEAPRWRAYLKLEAEVAAMEKRKETSPTNRDRSRSRKQERQVRANIKQKRWDRT